VPLALKNSRQFYYRPLQGDALVDNGNQGAPAAWHHSTYPRCIRSRPSVVNGYGPTSHSADRLQPV